MTKFTTNLNLEEANLCQIEPGKWVNIDEERPATEEEIKQHLEIRKRNDAKLEKYKEKIREENVSDSKEFENKYRKSIEEFWGDGYKDYSNWDRDDLILNLATALFDNYGLDNERGAEECSEDIKRLFPNEHYQALESFVCGNHDT